MTRTLRLVVVLGLLAGSGLGCAYFYGTPIQDPHVDWEDPDGVLNLARSGIRVREMDREGLSKIRSIAVVGASSPTNGLYCHSGDRVWVHEELRRVNFEAFSALGVRLSRNLAERSPYKTLSFREVATSEPVRERIPWSYSGKRIGLHPSDSAEQIEEVRRALGVDAVVLLNGDLRWITDFNRRAMQGWVAMNVVGENGKLLYAAWTHAPEGRFEYVTKDGGLENYERSARRVMRGIGNLLFARLMLDVHGRLEDKKGTEAPAAEVVETPVVEAPVVEAPVVETPVVDEPAPEAPAPEAAVVDEPAPEVPAPEAPVVDAPATEDVPSPADEVSP